jgi:hypothetical protein
MYVATIQEGNKNQATGLWSSDWKKYEIVADIPQTAHYILYGGQIAGTGQLWFDDIQIEIVDSDTREQQKEPLNLNIEE